MYSCHNRTIYRSHEKHLYKELNIPMVHFNSVVHKYDMFFSKKDILEEAKNISTKNLRKEEVSALTEFLNNSKNRNDTIKISSSRKIDTLLITDDNSIVTDTVVMTIPDTSLGLNSVQYTIAMEYLSFRLIKKGKAIITDENNNVLDFLIVTKFNNQHGGGEEITTPDGVRIGSKKKWIK